MKSKQRFFLKELVNNQIFFADGTPVPFVHGSDDVGYLAIDADDKKVGELEQFILKRRGGVTEVTEEIYAAEKKKQPWSRVRDGLPRAPRLFETSKDPFASNKLLENQSPAQIVVGQGAVKPAEVLKPAQPAVEAAKLDKPIGQSGKFKPRTAKPKS